MLIFFISAIILDLFPPGTEFPDPLIEISVTIRGLDFNLDKISKYIQKAENLNDRWIKNPDLVKKFNSLLMEGSKFSVQSRKVVSSVRKSVINMCWRMAVFLLVIYTLVFLYWRLWPSTEIPLQ